MSDDDGLLAHSNVVGGSSAARVIACPASYKELLKIPDTVDEPSVWAAEGTALHAAAAYCVGEDLPAHAVMGQVIEGFEMTEERVGVLAQAIKYVNDHIDGDTEFLLEQRVRFPGIPGGFGTGDFLWKRFEEGGCFDYKFGGGVKVYILYPDPDDPTYLIVNPQLLFYMVAAIYTYPEFFKDVKRFKLAIIQPRLGEPEDVWVDREELEEFRVLLVRKVHEAQHAADPHMERGPHCRWAACKSICKAWTAPLFDIEQLMKLQQQGQTLAALEASVAGLEEVPLPTPAPNDYGPALARALALAKKFEPWMNEVKRQAHVYMTNDGEIPGWKLVPKRANRNWIADDVAAKALTRTGLRKADIYMPPELRSPKQLEDYAKANKLSLKMPDGIIVKQSSGTTIAPDSDTRDVAPDDETVEQFARAIAKLQHGETT